MRYLALFAFLALFLPSSAFAGERKQAFAVYVVKEDHKYLDDVVLEDDPVLTEKDLIAYNWKNHSLLVSYAAMERLRAIRPRVFGEGFVVVARGVRCYRGVFMTSVSSVQSGLPTIIVDRRTDGKRENEFVIERAYPTPEYGLGDDPRGDPRIMEALKNLRKLK